MNIRNLGLPLVVLVLLSAFSFAVSMIPENARATTLFVGGMGPGNYTAIQDAIDDAGPGDVVYVYTGVYFENLVVSRALDLVGENRYMTIIDGGGTGDVISVEVDWVGISDFTVTNSGSLWRDAGIDLSDVQNCYIANSNISWNNGYGIYLYRSSGNAIVNNNISNNQKGIYLDFSASNIVADNMVSGTPSSGIYIDGSGNNVVANNTLSDTHTSISVSNSDNNTIVNNSASNNIMGIRLFDCDNNTVANNSLGPSVSETISIGLSEGDIVTNNTMADSGIRIWGDSIKHWSTHIIDSSNTVSQKPLHYWNNIRGGTVPLGAGQVILANCSGVTVEGQNISNVLRGIHLVYSSSNIISKNTVSNNQYGITLSSSESNIVTDNSISTNEIGVVLGGSNDNLIFDNMVSNNIEGVSLYESMDITITGNALSNNNVGIYVSSYGGNLIVNNTAYNNGEGITLSHSHRITVDNNIIRNNTDGIKASHSHDNLISNNTISSNSNGVYLVSSNDNTVYHNSLIENTNQAWDEGTNEWDSGYPLGGNYWSDYTGVDERSGPNQDQPGSDGIGDLPFDIPGGSNEDRYPLMSPFVAPPRHEGNELPTCTVDTPTPDIPLSGFHSIDGTASDLDGLVEKVEIRIDERPWIEVTGTTSWTYDWDTTTVEDGNHTIYVRSFDGTDYSSEVSVTVVVDNAPPQEPRDDWMWIVVGVAVVLVVILLALYLLTRRRKKRETEPEELPEAESRN